MERLINSVRMFSKRLILIIQEKSVEFEENISTEIIVVCVLDFVEFLIAISVTSHGDIREKLNMAFNMYGELRIRICFLANRWFFLRYR